MIGRWALGTSGGAPLARWALPPPLPGPRTDALLARALLTAGGLGPNDADLERCLVPEFAPLVEVRAGGPAALARGGLPLQRLGLVVRAPLAKPPTPSPPPALPPPSGPAWDYTVSSIFVPRAKKSAAWGLLDRLSLTDARSLHDNEGAKKEVDICYTIRGLDQE